MGGKLWEKKAMTLESKSQVNQEGELLTSHHLLAFWSHHN